MEDILPSHTEPTDYPFPPVPEGEGVHISEPEKIAIVRRLQEARTRQDLPLLPSPSTHLAYVLPLTDERGSASWDECISQEGRRRPWLEAVVQERAQHIRDSTRPK